MIDCLWACVLMQPIIVLYFESETVLKLYKHEARSGSKQFPTLMVILKEFFEKVNSEKIQKTTKS